MKILSVFVDGFKNLSNVRLNLDGMTALVSLNNFGKSNVLKAINFGLTFIRMTNGEKGTEMSNSQFMPRNKKQLHRDYHFEVELLADMKGMVYRVCYGYSFSWIYDRKEYPKICTEYLKIKPEKNGTKYMQLVLRDEKEATYKQSETGRCSSKILIDSNELVINKLRAYDNLFYIDLIKQMNQMKVYLENRFDVKSLYSPDPLIRKEFESMIVDAENLPRIIFELKQNHPEKFDLLKDSYHLLFPDIQDILVDAVSTHPFAKDRVSEKIPYGFTSVVYRLSVTDKNLVGPIDFQMMSDGAKRVFLILARVILASIDHISLIAVEEPENSVHPRLFQAYLQIISKLVENCKIIMTSHSPYVLSYLDPMWVYVGVDNHDGVASFYSFRERGRQLLEKEALHYDMGIGDYLFSLLADDDVNWKDYLEVGHEKE